MDRWMFRVKSVIVSFDPQKMHKQMFGMIQIIQTKNNKSGKTNLSAIAVLTPSNPVLSWRKNFSRHVTKTEDRPSALTLRLLPWTAFGIVVAFAVAQFATFASRRGSEGKQKISKTWSIPLLRNKYSSYRYNTRWYVLVNCCTDVSGRCRRRIVIFRACHGINWYVAVGVAEVKHANQNELVARRCDDTCTIIYYQLRGGFLVRLFHPKDR